MYTGHCSCKSIKITVTSDPVATALCHCHDCRRTSGTGFSFNWVVPAPAFEVEGLPKTWSTTSNSGNEVTAHFCDKCGTTLWRDGAATQGMLYVKAGILDDPKAVSAFQPQAEIFTSRRLPWLTPVKDAVQKEEMN